MAPFDSISEPAIASLLDRFYSKARRDPAIGPVFNNAIADSDEHLRKLCDFWSSVMLTSGRYKGNPMAAHMKQPIEPGFFDRWLALSRETAAKIFAPAVAAQFVLKAGAHGREFKARAVLRPGAIPMAHGGAAARSKYELPAGLAPYRSTPIFDQVSVPPVYPRAPTGGMSGR